MSAETIETRFRSAEERDRFNRLIQSREMHGYFRAGVDHGEKHAAPFIRSGAWGLTADEISRTIEEALRAVRKDQRSGPRSDRMSPDEMLCWRVGFEAVAFMAKIAFLARFTTASFYATPSDYRDRTP